MLTLQVVHRTSYVAGQQRASIQIQFQVQFLIHNSISATSLYTYLSTSLPNISHIYNPSPPTPSSHFIAPIPHTNPTMKKVSSLKSISSLKRAWSPVRTPCPSPSPFPFTRAKSTTCMPALTELESTVQNPRIGTAQESGKSENDKPGNGNGDRKGTGSQDALQHFEHHEVHAGPYGVEMQMEVMLGVTVAVWESGKEGDGNRNGKDGGTGKKE
jgi:hypothetical protein